jgi:hypothetical protein
MEDKLAGTVMGIERDSLYHPFLHRLSASPWHVDLEWADPDEQEDQDRGPRLLKRVWQNIGIVRTKGGIPVCHIERLVFSAYAVDGKMYGKTEFNYTTRIDKKEYYTFPGCRDIPRGAPSFTVDILTVDGQANVTLNYSTYTLSGQKRLDLGLREIKSCHILNGACLLRFTISKSVWACL